MAREVGEFNMNVNCIVPGATLSADPSNKTAFELALIDSAKKPYQSVVWSVWSIWRPRWNCNLLGFLQTATSLTGQTIVVDGGDVMLWIRAFIIRKLGGRLPIGTKGVYRGKLQYLYRVSLMWDCMLPAKEGVVNPDASRIKVYNFGQVLLISCIMQELFRSSVRCCVSAKVRALHERRNRSVEVDTESVWGLSVHCVSKLALMN